MTASTPPLAPAPVMASDLIEVIRLHDPNQFDDGLSDLSLAITLHDAQDRRLSALEQELRRRYLDPHLPPPAVSRLGQATRLAQQFTRQRLRQRPCVLRLGSGHEDRCLLLSVPRSLWAQLPDRQHVRARGGVAMYGLTRAAELQRWAAAHQVSVTFTPEQLAAARQRIGGTLQVYLRGGQISLVTLRAGYDPDRLLALRQIRTSPPPWPDVSAPELRALADVAVAHLLHCCLIQSASPRTFTAPHRSGAELHRRLRQVACLDRSAGHPEVNDTPARGTR